jgi:hypothetical protein
MNKRTVWAALLLFWVIVGMISWRVICHYGLLEKPLSEVGLEVE